MNQLSVIIPTRDRINFLLETIANINNQTVAPDEIIVVDDYSTDGTIDILKSE